jgi:formate C-acetyltransferase
VPYMRKNKPDNAAARKLFDIGEPYAGGFCEFPDRSLFYRHARAHRRFWEAVELPEYVGGPLYPCGLKYPSPPAVIPDYSYTCSVDWQRLRDKWDGAEACLEDLRMFGVGIGATHTVGGDGYTHSIPHYERVLGEGFTAYGERVGKLPGGDFRDGLFELLEGIRAYRLRCLAYLEAAGAGARLTGALSNVPEKPVSDFYEALVCWNFIYYIDGCDNPGRLDSGLIKYYRGGDAGGAEAVDTEAGGVEAIIAETVDAETVDTETDDAETVGLLRAFFFNVDANNGWSAAIGPDYNPLTLCCLRAIRGLRRPSLELRVVPDMPAEIWDAAADSIATGCGQPALYNEPLYQSALARRFPDIPAEDLLRFNGGGCTETMLAGISNVGSLDAGINLPAIFEPYMRGNLEFCDNFSRFYDGLLDGINDVTRDVMRKISLYQEKRASLRPQPVRTLLIEDCIDRGLDFNNGGARYCWSVVNIAGLVNVIDSLLAIKNLVYDTGKYAPRRFLDGLSNGDPEFLADARSAPRYGVDDSEADGLAVDFAGRVFSMFDGDKPWLGGQFLPSSIQFTTFADAGKNIGPTPDGRPRSAPLADSIGAVHGKDTAGVTALLNSVARLPLYKAAGTPVLNLRLQKSFARNALAPLILGFFKQGGMHAQISCVSREEMEDALLYPEKHENLIVRIGGYSEYFNRLGDELKRDVIARTEFS